MKKLLILLLVLPNLLLAQKPFTEADFVALNNRYMKNPVAYIQNETTSNFVYTGTNGHSMDKASTLKVYEILEEISREYTDTKVNSMGANAVVTSKLTHVSLIKSTGEKRTTYETLTATLVFAKGKWKLQTATHTQLSNADRNKAIYQKINQLANQLKLEEVSQYYAETHESKGIGKGPKAELIYAQAVMKSFPDMQIKILELIADGDLVMARCEATGTQLGELNGIPPTGKKGTIAHWTINRFNAEGKITESRNLNDNLGMMQQLGILK